MPTVAPRLRHPIVLVHGLMGFDALRLAGWSLFDYFPGIPAFLESAGNRVTTVSLSPTAGIEHRAIELREHLRTNYSDEPVHILAHSMGGLDARYMISQLDMADRVRSLTTIGTPHRGSPFADWGVRRLERLVRPVLRMLKIPHQAFYDLTTEACAAFNERTPDVETVEYHSIAGECAGGWVGLEWRLPYHIIKRAEGANDGMVSVASARWGQSTDVWNGDHLSLVNWPNTQAFTLGLWRSRYQQYARILERLKVVDAS